MTSVGVDERAAGRIATEHLIELGHQRIGFVAGYEYALPTREKKLGRRDALRAAGLSRRARRARRRSRSEAGARRFGSSSRGPRTRGRPR